jgi:RND family efflux transporter MFP subunit
MNPVKTRNRLFPYCRGKAISILLAPLIILSFTACGKKEPEVAREVIRPVKTAIVKAGIGFGGLTLPGKVRASKRVNLAFQKLGGRLTQLPIAGREGQEVKEGELLARIDPRDYEIALRDAEARLARARATLKAMRQARPEDIRRLTANMEKAKAAKDLAQNEYDRILRIQAQDAGAVSQGMIDKAVEKLQRADANVRTAQEELRVGKIGARPEDIQAKEAEIRSLAAAVDAAKDQLSYTYLKAPFAGIIARRYVDNYQEVQPKQPIVSLQDITHVEILVDLPENLMAISREESGAKIVVEFPTLPEKQYPVSIKEIATEADPATQTYQVVFQMPQPEEIRVLPGMTATVRATLSDEKAAEADIVIPAIAVTADPKGQDYVWVVDPKEMTVRKKDVRVGSVVGTADIRILDGLKGGEKIVVAGVTKLQDGMKVRLWKEQQE